MIYIKFFLYVAKCFDKFHFMLRFNANFFYNMLLDELHCNYVYT